MSKVTNGSPEGKVLQIVWRCMIGMAAEVSEMYRWVLTGIAAAIALVLANLSSIESVIGPMSLRVTMALLTISFASAALAFILSQALKLQNEMIQRIVPILQSGQCQELFTRFSLTPREFVDELCKPFSGPLGWIVRRSGEKGINDELAKEKAGIALIVWQAYAMWLSLLFAAAALIAVVVGVT
jgi:hypothetical protein